MGMAMGMATAMGTAMVTAMGIVRKTKTNEGVVITKSNYPVIVNRTTTDFEIGVWLSVAK